jgi:hypothetical protein
MQPPGGPQSGDIGARYQPLCELPSAPIAQRTLRF